MTLSEESIKQNAQEIEKKFEGKENDQAKILLDKLPFEDRLKTLHEIKNLNTAHRAENSNLAELSVNFQWDDPTPGSITKAISLEVIDRSAQDQEHSMLYRSDTIVDPREIKNPQLLAPQLEIAHQIENSLENGDQKAFASLSRLPMEERVQILSQILSDNKQARATAPDLPEIGVSIFVAADRTNGGAVKLEQRVSAPKADRVDKDGFILENGFSFTVHLNTFIDPNSKIAGWRSGSSGRLPNHV